jgi:hypothetical protein
MPPGFDVDALSLSELTGWLVAALTASTIFIALFARSQLQHHYWIGYAIGALSFLHASLSMGGLAIGGSAALTGVLVATAGMFLSWGQALLGSRLRGLEGRVRGAVRRLHLANAMVLVGLGVAHLLLNGPLVRALLRL